MKTQFVKFLTLALTAVLYAAIGVAAQTEPPTDKKVNFGYSRNPKTKIKSAEPETKAEVIPSVETTTENAPSENREFESRSVASKTLEVVKRANKDALPPTEIYKIGAGDVLFISLQNAPAKDSTYFTVLNDGTIDYPLAGGEMISVIGLTAEEIEDSMRKKIKLYENPQISIKVREHTSHRITVLGLVEKAGEKYLPREAVPLYMIRAEAVVQPRADAVFIKRANQQNEHFDLREAKSDDILIFPGDIVEFKSSGDNAETNSGNRQFYFIGGSIVSTGQKDFHSGLTLTQAILASGGLRRATVKKVIIRRKSQGGLLSPMEFDLNLIKGGKQPDPQIIAGDTIEVVN